MKSCHDCKHYYSQSERCTLFSIETQSEAVSVNLCNGRYWTLPDRSVLDEILKMVKEIHGQIVNKDTHKLTCCGCVHCTRETSHGHHRYYCHNLKRYVSGNRIWECDMSEMHNLPRETTEITVKLNEPLKESITITKIVGVSLIDNEVTLCVENQEETTP